MNLELARQQMVEQQVRCWDVFDRAILALLDSIARDEFVPPRYRHLAYADTEVPLPCGQRMMTPIVEGRLLQALKPAPSDVVLEVGSGSGFLTACLSKLAATVISLDIHDELVEMATRNLADAGIENVSLHRMDATRKLPPGDFDVIAVTGSIPRFDERYVRLLKPGGRLFVVVGQAPVMDALLVTRSGPDDWQTEALFETRIPALTNAAATAGFSF